MKTFLKALFAATVLGTLVTGCGGGGGGGGGVSSVDIIRPTIVLTLPANDPNTATNPAIVGTTTPIIITFSEPMNNASVAGAFSITPSVTGTFSFNGATATFKPSSLNADTTYTATIAATAQDEAGNPLVNGLTWKFKTGVGPDTTPPTVQSYAPTAADAGINSTIAITFSEPMDSESVKAAFSLTGSTNIPGTFAFFGETAVFTPSTFLAPSQTYTVTLTTAAKDLAGNGITAPVTWSFTTKSATPSNPGVDFDAPTIAQNSNSPTGINAPRDSSISVSFNEPIAPFYYGMINGYPTRVTIDYATNTVTMAPTTLLTANAPYTVTIRARDLSGNLMNSAFTWGFTTGATP